MGAPNSLFTAPGGGRGGALPGRQALRGYTNPSMDPKYAPGRGAPGGIYAARVRAAAGKPMTGVGGGGPGSPERALRAYEGGGPLTGATSARVNPQRPGAGIAGGQGSLVRPLSEPGAPGGITFGGNDPLQRRTEIATQGLSGSAEFINPAVLNYYYDLSRYSLMGAGGGYEPYGNIQPIEHQFLSGVLGQTAQQPTTQGFLEAVRRGTARL